MNIADIPWYSRSCCGQHKSADIPVPDGSVLKIQHEGQNGFVVMRIKPDGLLDASIGDKGVFRDLSDEEAGRLIESLSA